MQKLEQLGQRLQAAREYHGLSLEDLSRESRISVEHIRNLEAARREALPEEAFTLGYITKICKILGIENRDLVLDEFKQAEADQVLAEIVNESTVVDKQVKHRSRRAWVYSLVILLLLLAAWFVYDISFKRAQSSQKIATPAFVHAKSSTGARPKIFGKLRSVYEN